MSDNLQEWSYRVVRRESEDGSDEWYSIQEVYYDNNKEPMAQTTDLQIESDTVSGMREQLSQMLRALDEPVIDEIEMGDFSNFSDIEERVSLLETENDKLKGRVEQLNREVIKVGVDGVKEEKSL